MTWVRYDDRVANHPKIRDLDDATYRLWREAIEWSSAMQTDGVIRRADLSLTSRRASPARARKLVQSGLWHEAGHRCDHPRCPPSGVDGWVIHDYWDYQPTAEEVRREQEKARERVRKWRAKQKGNGVRNGVTNDVTDAVTNGETYGRTYANPAPSRPAPAPTGRAGPNGPVAPAAASSGGAAAAGGVEDPPTSLPESGLAEQPCEHGQPGGLRPHPATGRPMCPLCRHGGSLRRTA